MYNNNIRTDSEIHKFINSEFRNYRLRLGWPCLNVEIESVPRICSLTDSVDRFYFGSKRPF